MYRLRYQFLADAGIEVQYPSTPAIGHLYSKANLGNWNVKFYAINI